MNSDMKNTFFQTEPAPMGLINYHQRLEQQTGTTHTMVPRNIQIHHCNIATTEHVTFDKILPDTSPMVDIAPNKLRPRLHNLTSDPQDERQANIMPAAALISPCCSEESSSASMADINYNYRIDSRVLGTGHQGAVRGCINRTTGGQYAVKSIRKSAPAVPTGDLTREIMLLQELNHRNIVRLIGVYEDVEYLHIITDLCEGGELYDKIIDNLGCFAEDKAATILHQILAAVSYMHKRGVVHRDLKPENILFENTDADSPIKVVDFGLARKHFGSRGELSMRAVVGTTYYIAPEVLQRKYDKSCDLWSVGVIAYVLLCGFLPFNGATDEEVDKSVRRCQYQFPAGTSREARDFIRRLLQKDPRKRMTAEQALNHPWMVKHINNDVVMSDEARQDNLSVEVVFKGSSERDSIIFEGNENPNTRLTMLC